MHLFCFYGSGIYSSRHFGYIYMCFHVMVKCFFNIQRPFDTMFSSLIISMLQKITAQGPILQDCYLPSFAMPYLTYWHQPKSNWITHWLEVGSFKLRADEDYMSFTWWCKKLVRRLSFLKLHFYSKFNKSKKGIL